MDTLIVLGSDGLTFRGEVGGLVDWLPFLTKLYYMWVSLGPGSTPHNHQKP